MVLSELNAIQQELCPSGPSCSGIEISRSSPPQQDQNKSQMGPMRTKSEVVRRASIEGREPVGRSVLGTLASSQQDMHVQLSARSCAGKYVAGAGGKNLFADQQQPSTSWI